jgi:hypothetical protein
MSGLILAPVSSIILIFYIRPMLPLSNDKKKIWTQLALIPFFLFCGFLINMAFLFVFVKVYFARGW